MNRKAIEQIMQFINLKPYDIMPYISNDVAEYVLEILKQQEKVIPIKEIFVNKFGQRDYRYICGECYNLLSYDKPLTQIPLEHYADRCRISECNKLVDWSKAK